MSPIRRKPVSGETKGKDANTTVPAFKADIAVAWCRTQLHATEFINRVWASGEIITDPNVFGGLGTDEVDKITANSVPKQNPNCSPAWITNFEQIDFFFRKTTITSDFADLLFRLRADQDITITGASLDPLNAGTFTVQSVASVAGGEPLSGGVGRFLRLRVIKCVFEYQGGGIDSCTPITSCPAGVSEPGGFDVTIDQGTFDDSPYYDSFERYPGSSDQAVDPTIASFEGADIPAFRGTAYCVYKDFDLSKWAGTVPSFEAEISEHDDRRLSDVIENLIERTEGFPLQWVDTTAIVVDPVVKGFSSYGPTDIAALIEQLMLIYDIEVQLISTFEGTPPSPQPTLRFVPRSNVGTIEIASEDYSARDLGTEGPPSPVLQYRSEDEIPQELMIDYINPARDLQPATVSYQLTKGAVINQQKLATSLTMSRDFASRTAKKLLWAMVSRNNTAVVNLPPSYADIVPGDRLDITLPNDEDITLRVTKVDRGAQGLHEIAGELDDVSLYEQFGVSIEDPFDNQTFANPAGVFPLLLDLPPLTRHQAYNFGITLAIQSAVSELNQFRQGAIFLSCDNGDTFVEVNGYNEFAMTGTARTVLAEADPSFWDYTSTVEVEFEGGTLTNENEESVACGANWISLGGEILGFQTATLVEDSIYILSGLLRGLRDTRHAISEHVISEQCVVLEVGVFFNDLQFRSFQADSLIRLVPSGEAVEDQGPTHDIHASASAQSIVPFSVHSIWVNRLANSKICIYATPQSRVPFRVFGGVDNCDDPTMDEFGKFCCEVYRQNVGGTEWIYLRRLCGFEAQNGQIGFCYDRESQVVDSVGNGFGGVLTDDHRFVVYQRGASLVDGRTTEFCIDSSGVTHHSADCEL
jgi:hypothetical protein